jgi:hypothetical protein
MVRVECSPSLAFASVLCTLVWMCGCGRLRYDSILDANRTHADAPSMDALGDTSIGDAPRSDDAFFASDAVGDDAFVAGDAGACSPCSVLPQCGCSASLTCRTQESSGSTVCERFGSALEGELCNTRTECAPGLSCARLPGRSFPGMCVRYCRTDAECAGDDRCVQIDPAFDIGLCDKACDPITGGGCPAMLFCHWFATRVLPSRSIEYVSICSLPGGAPAGTPCMLPSECQMGTTCLMNTCRTICDRSAPMCPSGTCSDPRAPGGVGDREFGLCY